MDSKRLQNPLAKLTLACVSILDQRHKAEYGWKKQLAIGNTEELHHECNIFESIKHFSRAQCAHDGVWMWLTWVHSECPGPEDSGPGCYECSFGIWRALGFCIRHVCEKVLLVRHQQGSEPLVDSRDEFPNGSPGYPDLISGLPEACWECPAFVKKTLDWQLQEGKENRLCLFIILTDSLNDMSHDQTMTKTHDCYCTSKCLKKVCTINWKSWRQRGDSCLVSVERTGGVTHLPVKPGFARALVWVSSAISQSFGVRISSYVLKTILNGSSMLRMI